MFICQLCSNDVLERSLPFGYKMLIPRFKISRVNASPMFNDGAMLEYEEGLCRFLEIGLNKRLTNEIDRTDDVIIILSDPFTHCTNNEHEIRIDMEEWKSIMCLRECVERYFANVPVIERYAISDSLEMYFDIYNKNSDEQEKFVFLTRDTRNIRLSQQIMTILFTLSDFIDIMYKQYLMKVPYACYLYEKFAYIARIAAATVCSNTTTTTTTTTKTRVTRFIRNHWFYDETSTIHKELLIKCIDELVKDIEN